MKEKIIFKSSLEFYDRERWGFKPNTVRKLNPNDNIDFQRIRQLETMRDGVYDTEKIIKIIHSKNKEESFERKITDISLYLDMWIISWKHPQDQSKI